MLRSSHVTACSGEIVTFAPHFNRHQGPFSGYTYEPFGFYEISASDKTVLVHHAIMDHPEELEEFCKAMRAAYSAHNTLRTSKNKARLFPPEPTTPDPTEYQ